MTARLLGANALLLGLLALGGAEGCRSPGQFAPVDLAASGWHVQHGQAVWKPGKNRPELAGDLLLATNGNGNLYVQFSKNPFPLAAAQILSGRWEIQFGADKYYWSGKLPPPNRFGWFQLAAAMQGAKVSGRWQFSGEQGGSWGLTNSSTGESLEGEFFP